MQAGGRLTQQSLRCIRLMQGPASRGPVRRAHVAASADAPNLQAAEPDLPPARPAGQPWLLGGPR